MARDHFRLKTSIWANDDFRKLPGAAQRMYLVLGSQPTLTWAGVLDWWPNRLAKLAADTDEDAVYGAVSTLIDARFVVFDTETSEVLLRTFIRHDNVLIRRNMGKACVDAIGRVTSLELVEAIVVELARLQLDEPGLAGFVGIEEKNPELWRRVMAKQAVIHSRGD